VTTPLHIDRYDVLDLDGYRRVVVGGECVEVAEPLYEQVDEGRAALLELVGDGVAVYGVTAGLGYLTDRRIGLEDQDALQRSLLLARASGLGPPLPDEVVRGVMLLRLTGFLSGYAGVTSELCRFLVDRLNDGWAPVVPNGPYGAAGEIAPLGHLFQTFIGEGHVRRGDDVVPASIELERRGASPYEPMPKEGSALLNGAPFATALAVYLSGRCRVVLESAHVAAALATELVGASTRPYSARVGALSRDPAQLRVHERLLELLAGGAPFEDRLQAPASFRVVPQVHGAFLDQIETLEARLERQLRAVTDSPLVLPADGDEPAGSYPSGAFHAAASALAVDGLAIGVSHMTNLHEKRLHRLLDSRFSGLPEQLAVDPGTQAGVIALHKAVVGLAAENRLLAAPASVHAVDTSSGQEDLQAFVFLAADKLGRALDNLELAVACELVALRQGYHLRGTPPPQPILAAALEALEEAVAPVEVDRTLTGDVERARALVVSEALLSPRR
jgi:histidine ammonia-lyase